MLTRISLIVTVVFTVGLGLVGCGAAPQPTSTVASSAPQPTTIVGKWEKAAPGTPGTWAFLYADVLEFKSDGTYIAYDNGKYSLSGNVLTEIRKTGTVFTDTITLEGNTLKGFGGLVGASEFKRVGGDPKAGIVGMWERVPTASANANQFEFKQDGTYSMIVPAGKYTLPDQKTIEMESSAGGPTQSVNIHTKDTESFTIVGDTLTIGTGAIEIAYKRVK